MMGEILRTNLKISIKKMMKTSRVKMMNNRRQEKLIVIDILVVQLMTMAFITKNLTWY